MGFVIPAVRIQDNLQLGANQYSIKLKEVDAGTGEVRPDMLMVMDPSGAAITLPGEDTTEPAFGLPAKWIGEAHRDDAHARHYTVIPPPTVITTHLTEIVKENISELLSFAETQKLLDGLTEEHKKLVEDTVPSVLPISGLQRVLQNLLSEQVSIRDLPTILEAISEVAKVTNQVALITEHVRTRLARQISFSQLNAEGVVPVVTLSESWEQIFAESLIDTGNEKTLAMQPSQLQQFMHVMGQEFEKLAMSGHMPVLLTTAQNRPYVRAVVERFRPVTVVMGQAEVHPKVKLKSLGII